MHQPLTTTTFIEKAKTVHGDKYDYSLVSYTRSGNKVTIICPTHGKFEQVANNHLRGTACPKCGASRGAGKQKSTLASFSKKANEVHNNYYTYTNGVYLTARKNIVITCPLHGDFEQLPTNHLKGVGCPSCNGGMFNPSKATILYFLSINDGQAYKVGITNKTINERFTVKDLKSIVVLDTLSFPNGRDAYLMEQKILKHYHNHKYTGTNLLESGNTELLTINIIEESSLDHISQTLKDL